MCNSLITDNAQQHYSELNDPKTIISKINEILTSLSLVTIFSRVKRTIPVIGLSSTNNIVIISRRGRTPSSMISISKSNTS